MAVPQHAQGDKPNLLGLTLPEMTSFFAELGEKPFRAKQVFRWIHHFGVDQTFYFGSDRMLKYLAAVVATFVLHLASTLAHAEVEAGNNSWYKLNTSDTVIVFVHGIFSNSKECWTTTDATPKYWPQLLSEDRRFENPSVYLGGYFTSTSSGIYRIPDAAAELLSSLRNKSFKGEPAVLSKKGIVFVAHSTGGLVVRYMLERNATLFQDKAVGLVLLASPSRGSEWADRLKWLRKLFGNRMAGQLSTDNDLISDLDSRFADFVSNRRIRNLVGIDAFENRFIIPGFPFNAEHIVDASTSASYFGAYRVLPNTDHFSIAKPTSATHPSHQLLWDFYDNRFRANLEENRAVLAGSAAAMVAAPLTLQKSGIGDASVQLPPENYRRQIRVTVTAVAQTDYTGGCMRIETSGVGSSCTGERVYRNPGSAKQLRSVLECASYVEAKAAPTIRATAPNGGSLSCPGTDAESIELSVTASPSQ